MESWVRAFENELSALQEQGAKTRCEAMLAAVKSKIQRCIHRQPSERKEITSCVVIEDGNVGYLLLTTVDNEPQALVFDAPEDDGFSPEDEEQEDQYDIAYPSGEFREPWNPPKELWEPFDLFAALEVPGRHKASLKDEVRLSPANLGLFMGAHRILAAHTDKLQHAVSDLFNRCQRLQDEYRDQIWRAASLIPKIDGVGQDEDTDSIEDRLEKVKAKQEKLNARYLAIRRKASGINDTVVSEKEAAFTSELQTMESSIDRTKQNLTDDVDGSEVPAWQRLEKVKTTNTELAKEVQQTVQVANNGAEKEQQKGLHAASARINVPSHSRKQENEQVQLMLQHQADLLEATTNRLRSSGIAIQNLSSE
jgi:nucleoporin NUP82